MWYVGWHNDTVSLFQKMGYAANPYFCLPVQYLHKSIIVGGMLGQSLFLVEREDGDVTDFVFCHLFADYSARCVIYRCFQGDYC
ncbi:hypothetical protein SDC9_152929 [bioreactor metagenome]|uniref:Uncharacterized protein n=1 Tax=bioreactor metagenome TaxID=1076179 RepID=A0A645EUG2_9ZZZZ